jgi:riboflavin kinase
MSKYMKNEYLSLLLELARMGAAKKTIFLSSSKLSSRIKASQQTASRKLCELERSGFITRSNTVRGQSVRLTEKGAAVLEEIYYSLKRIIEEEFAELSFEGKVVSGMGEGKYYISQTGYCSQFEDKLGFSPYPGTLNLLLEHEQDMYVRQELEVSPYILVEGFSNGSRTFGAVKCYKVEVNGVGGALIMPIRTHHPKNVIEVISQEYLKGRLRLKDGDYARVKVLV